MDIYKYLVLIKGENKTEVIPENNLDKYSLSSNKFDYFKEISKIVSVKTEDGIGILTKEYEKINFIEKDTALYQYLNPMYKNSEIAKSSLDEIIFPFGANESQFEAVKNAINNQISIIEGPPGTGKTQTILNIIANIVKRGQTVAVVSNNNAATDNVYEKLQKYNLDYLCARLGKKENKDEFIQKQTGEYPQFTPKLENKQEIENEIAILNQEITEIFSIQNEIAKLKEILSETQIEHKYFNEYEGDKLGYMPQIRRIDKATSDIIMKLKVELEDMSSKNIMV